MGPWEVEIDEEVKGPSPQAKVIASEGGSAKREGDKASDAGASEGAIDAGRQAEEVGTGRKGARVEGGGGEAESEASRRAEESRGTATADKRGRRVEEGGGEGEAGGRSNIQRIGMIREGRGEVAERGGGGGATAAAIKGAIATVGGGVRIAEEGGEGEAGPAAKANGSVAKSSNAPQPCAAPLDGQGPSWTGRKAKGATQSSLQNGCGAPQGTSSDEVFVLNEVEVRRQRASEGGR